MKVRAGRRSLSALHIGENVAQDPVQPVKGVDSNPGREPGKRFAAAIEIGAVGAPPVGLLAEAQERVADRTSANGLLDGRQSRHPAHRVHGDQSRLGLLSSVKQPFERRQVHRQRFLGHHMQATLQARERPGRYPVVAAADLHDIQSFGIEHLAGVVVPASIDRQTRGVVECSGRFLWSGDGDRDELQFGDELECGLIGVPVAGGADQSEADRVFSHGVSPGQWGRGYRDTSRILLIAGPDGQYQACSPATRMSNSRGFRWRHQNEARAEASSS